MVHLRRAAGTGASAWRRIYEEWRSGILEGRYRAGMRVPSTRELAATLGVARGTVTAAWDQLLAEGYFESVRGSGTFVSRELPDKFHTAAGAGARANAGGGGEELGDGAVPVAALSRYGRELPPEPRYEVHAPGVIAFPPGVPDLDAFPMEVWRRLMARHLREVSAELMDYVDEPAGDARLREQVAAYLARTRAVRCSAGDIVVTNGSQQALDLIARVLVDPGDAVALEDPGYGGAQQILRAVGARLVPVGLDGSGIAVAGCSERCKLVYVTPSHQYPTGVSMSASRRLELIEWAAARGTVIVEDDYSSEYRYSGAPLPSLQGLGGSAAVVYVGTFSKVMFPGLRIGYLVAPKGMADLFRRAKWHADRNTPVLPQRALADFIEEGHLDRHVRWMRRLYGRRREALVSALEEGFGDRVRVVGDAAGMQLMARFEDRGIGEKARGAGVHVRSADRFYLSEAPGGELIFGFAALGEAAIREGIRRLAAVCR